MNNKLNKYQNLFGGLITSKTRVRILMRLFLNPSERAYLRELAKEFVISPSLIKEELHQLTEAGLLESSPEGRHILYRANTKHALFPELNSMVMKALGMDEILESVIRHIGNLELALLLDDYATGKDSGLIDLVLVGRIDRTHVHELVRETEKHIGRKIRVLSMDRSEYEQNIGIFENRPRLTLWRDSTMRRQGRITLPQ